MKGEYALQAVFDLAVEGDRGPVKIAEIARRQHIPQKFLELILSSLKQGGFVESRRGAEGGYLLARPAETISVGQVLRFVEGQRQERAQLRQREPSPFHDMWQSVDRAISDVIDRTSFSDLVRTWKEQHSRYVPDWDI